MLPEIDQADTGGRVRVRRARPATRWTGGRTRSRQTPLAALREVAALLARDEAVLESLSDAVFVSDLAGNILYMNPAGLALYGFETLEAVQKPHAILRQQFEAFERDNRRVPPERYPLMRVIAGEQISGYEMTLRRVGAAESRTLSYNGALAEDASGRPILAVVTARDVTERRRQEAELRRTRDELQILLDVSSSLVSTLDLSRLLQLLVAKFKEVAGATAVSVLRLAGDELLMVAYDGPAPREEALTVRLPAYAGFAFPRVIQAAAHVYVEDLESDSPLAQEWRRSALARQKEMSAGFRSWLSLPLTVQGRVVGVVRLAHTRPNHFPPETIRLAAGIANQAAVALENASLHAETREAAIWGERERLARELHDSVSQILFGVDMATFSALTNLDKNLDLARERLQLAQTLNRAAQKEMRALIYELRSDTIATNGLVATLESAADALKERYALDLAYQLCPEPEVSLQVKESFYRVAVEALNNAGKHAPGGSVQLGLCADGDDLVLEVLDHGPGFDPQREYDGHLGLKSMQERATRIGAALTLQSAAGQGTRLRLAYPLRGAADPHA